MADLFEGCSDDEVTLKTDNSYAKRYDEWRRKEELMKAKARFGSDLEDSSSSDEEEDDEASQWTSEHEKKFLTALSAIKTRDPKIYNKDEVIFPEVSAPEQKTATESHTSGKMTLKDYERKIMTIEGGRYADEDDEQQRRNIFEETHQDRLAYDAEQRELRESLKKAAWGAGKQDQGQDDDDDDDDDGGEVLLTKKTLRSQEEQQADDEEYIKWLKGETKKLSNKKDAKDLAGLKKLWSSEGDENLDDAEKFLRDYVLNKRYLTANEDDCRFEVDFSEDEKDLAAMTEFEHKYNFRFEDPDPDFIKRYPRTIEDSMRRKDTRRVDKKAERKARREQLKIQMKEEVNRLKSFKKKEISDKIEKLRTIAGSEDIAFDDADVEEDFDPAEHDKRMAALFASYDNEAGEDNYPELDENEHEDLRWENWDNYHGDQPSVSDDDNDDEFKPSTSRESRLEDSDENSNDSAEGSVPVDDESENSDGQPGNPDVELKKAGGRITSKSQQHQAADEDLDAADEGLPTNGDGIERNDAGKLIVRGKKSAKLVLADVLPERSERKRKKSKFAEAISKEKPSFDPEKDKSFEKYFDDYYKLDFEDVVAGMPTRFKYRQVIPNDFGLSTEEVLQSKDKELNKWCSLKKMVQYRSKEEEDKDLQTFSKRRNHLQMKKKILTSVYSVEVEKVDDEIAVAAGKAPDEPVAKSKSRKNKKKKKKTDEKLEASADEARTPDAIVGGNEPEKVGTFSGKAKKRKSEFLDPTSAKKKKTKNYQQQQYNVQFSLRTFSETEVNEEASSRVSSAGELEHVTENQKSPKEAPPQKGDTASPTASTSVGTIPWDQLTPKQKKNRRNYLTKKRKKLEQKQQRAETLKMHKQKFKPLEDLKISDARMKAYGLNPKRVKGDLVYGDARSKKRSL